MPTTKRTRLEPTRPRRKNSGDSFSGSNSLHSARADGVGGPIHEGKPWTQSAMCADFAFSTTDGRLGMYLALCGAQVWGFDLSGLAIETANEVVCRYGLSAQFEQMDAEELRYADDSFDLAIGFGVLHHVIKYPSDGSQLSRVLSPGGRAVFHETLWDNPLINLVRRFTGEH